MALIPAALFFLITAFLLVSLLLIVLGASEFADARFKENWPPISEDEFMQRCSPGTDRARALKARRIISEHVGVEYERIYPEQSFVQDFGFD